MKHCRYLALVLVLALLLPVMAMPARAAAEDVTINETNFPDATLRELVKQEVDTNQDGILSVVEAETILSANLANMTITSLKGLEYFTKLQELDCSGNLLTELDISRNTDLVYLNCSGNALNSLDISKNAKLYYLECYENLLTGLNVTQNSQLALLDCNTNQLTGLDLSKNPALVYLDCYNNQLSSLDVSKNSALRVLDCSLNQIPSLQVSYLTDLEGLYCDGNLLTSLDVTKNAKLTDLGCSYNKLTSLDLSHNPLLVNLLCGDNALTSLDVTGLKNLELFYVQNTSITSLDLRQNRKLNDLFLEGTPLTKLYMHANTTLLIDNIFTAGKRAIICQTGASYDVAALTEMDISKASGWTGATVSGTVITRTADTISFTYDLGSRSCNVSMDFEKTHTDHTGDILCDICSADLRFKLNGANLKLGDSLTIFFYIQKSDLEPDQNYYAIVERSYADGRPAHIQTLNLNQWEVFDDRDYRIPYSGIAAKEMCDQIKVTVYREDGTQVSHTWIDSVKDYAVRVAARQTTDVGKMMYVNLLNYGGAAQTFFGYASGADQLASRPLHDGTLDASLKNFAQQTRELSDERVKGTNYTATTISCKNSLMLTLYFKNVSSTMTAKVSYTTHYGKPVEMTIDGKDFYYDAQYDEYGVDITGMSMGSYGSLVTVEIYDGDTLVAYAKDSIGSYLYRKLNTADGDVFYSAVAKVLTGAYTYLHRND